MTGTAVALSGRAELLHALIGTENGSDHERYFEFYLSLLMWWLKDSCLHDWLHKNELDVSNSAFSALATVAKLLRSAPTTDDMMPTMEDIMRGLADKKAFPQDVRVSEDGVWIQMVFAMVSWLTLIYKPDHSNHLQDYLTVVQESSAVFQAPSQLSANLRKLSIDVMVNRFGTVLPQKPEPRSLQPGQDIIKLSELNASHLWKVKKIRVKWTMTIGTHLTLDKTSKTLCVFCLPSVFRLQHGNPDSPVSR